MSSARGARPRRRPPRGQSVVIFALTSTLIFVSLGLAIDAGVSYVAANRVERAAAAAALEGVPYMPDQLPTGKTAAAAAAARSGYTNGVNGVTVTVYPMPKGCDGGGSLATCVPYRLGATVSVPVVTTFLHIVGFGTHTVTQSATAEYLSTLALGQPGYSIGSSSAQLPVGGAGADYYTLRMEGWNVDRLHGDAWGPNPLHTLDPANCKTSSTIRWCNDESPPQTAKWGDSTDIHALHLNSEAITVPAGWNTLPSRGGFSYQLVIPSGQAAGAHLQVYHPEFANDSNTDIPNNYYEGLLYGGNDPTEFGATEYTLYYVPNQFDHSGDVPISQVVVHPIKTAPQNVATPTSAVDQKTMHALNAATLTAWYHKWVDIENPGATVNTEASATSLIDTKTCNTSTYVASCTAALPPGTYRLRVDLLDNNGLSSDPADAVGGSNNHSLSNKNIAVRLVTNVTSADPPAGVDICATCQVGALNELTIYTPVTGTTDFPIVRIGPEYAGQTIQVFMFDPGDVKSATANTISVLDPFAPATPLVVKYHVLDVTSGNASGDLFATGTSAINIWDNGVSLRPSITPNLVNSDGNGTMQPNTKKALVNTLTGSCGAACEVYSSKWVEYDIPIPTNYAPLATNLAAQYWALEYVVSGGVAAVDTISIAVGFNGPPVHLVP